MTLQLIRPSSKHGAELSAHGLLGRNHEEETSSETTLTKVSVEQYRFSEGSERAAYKVNVKDGSKFVLKRIKRSTQNAKDYVDIRNMASKLAEVRSFKFCH